MAKIIAICGKICAGKSYYTKQIKEKENAVVLSCDEIINELFDKDLGEKHDEMTIRICNYFKNKSVELINIGCNVILDWGFWSREGRRKLTEIYDSQNIPCEWHYIDVDDMTWYKNILERNSRVLSDNSTSEYFLDEGLLGKCLSLWESPTEDEIDIWYKNTRE